MTDLFRELGELANLQAGVGFPTDLQGKTEGDYPFAKVGDISRASRNGLTHLSSADNFVSVAEVEQLKAKIIPRGSVLFAKIGEAIRQNHRVIAGTDLLVDNNAMAAIPNNLVDGKYLYHFLRTIDFYALTSSTTVPALRKSELERIKIPLPPLSEQKRIAEILDRAEALRAKRRAALALLDELTQSIFLDMFGDPVSNPKGWNLVKFEQLCSRITVGIVVKPASYYVGSGVPALRSLNVKPGKIVMEDLVFFSQLDNETKLKKTKLKSGDLVLVRSGQPGTCAVIPHELDGVNAIDLLIASPNDDTANQTFLCEFFNSAGGRDLVLSKQRGQIQKHLNVGALNEALIPLPPLALQCKFAARAASTKELESAVQNSLVELDQLFASLQHRAFRGEL